MAPHDRGELSQLQIELTTLEGSSPRSSLLQSRISDLLRIHGVQWAGTRAASSWKCIKDDVDEPIFVQQFGPIFGTSDHWQFHNGRLDTCSIAAPEFVELGDAIRNQMNLVELSLHDIGGPGLIKSREERLEKCMQYNAPEIILENERRSLAKAQRCCPIESLVECQAMEGIQSLRFERLGLFGTEFETFSHARFLRNIESLYFYQSSDAVPELYRALSKLPKLRQLDIEFYSDSCGDRDIEVGSQDDALALASSPALGNLRVLRLRYHEIGNEGMLGLVGSKHLANLDTLDLRGNYSITNLGLAQLAAMPEAQKLRRLNLSQCNFDNDGVLALARSPHLSNLEELHLAPVEESYERGKKIHGEEFIVELGKSACLPTLRRLDFSHQMIGDKGIRFLSQLPRFERFERLVLKHQGMTDEGLIAFVNSPYPPALQELDITWNDFGDAGFSSLCQSSLAFGVQSLCTGTTQNTGALLASSRFDNLVELRIERLDDSILEPIADSGRLGSLRRLIFRSGEASGMLLRKTHQPVHLVRQ